MVKTIVGRNMAHKYARRIKTLDICEKCNTAKAVDVHHIDDNPWNNFPRNLMGLCEPCHYRMHQDAKGRFRKSSVPLSDH